MFYDGLNRAFCVCFQVENRSRSLTLSMQFKKSLERLMIIINGCQPYFVRCIKPNEFKMANCFDRNLCVRQLRYSGMMETIQIRRLGYPIRYDFVDFVSRFYMALRAAQKPLMSAEKRRKNPQEATRVICRAAFGEFDLTYAIGSTKVFLRVSGGEGGGGRRPHRTLPLNLDHNAHFIGRAALR